MSDLALRLTQAIRHAVDPFRGPLGVAVSGGSDSMALLHASVAALGRARVRAVTVDHGLRTEARSEAEDVGRRARDLGVSHDILTWEHWDGTGNVSDQARRARYGLMAEWARAHGIAALAVGHTADDQAETFLMRLSRRAGLVGLAGMASSRDLDGVTLIRPFLAFGRAELRDYLSALDQAWIDDPSNNDESYDRVRVRKALPILAEHGVDARLLADVAGQLRDARAVVDQVAHDFLQEHARVDAGDIVLRRAALVGALPDIQRRVLSHALCWVSGADYAPRSDALQRAISDAVSCKDTVLHGCLLLSDSKSLRVARELAAVKGTQAEVGALWDGRWIVQGGRRSKGLSVRAVGASGLLDCPDWRGTGRPRAALLASPGVWDGERLVAAPLAGHSNGWTATLGPQTPDFYRSILSR